MMRALSHYNSGELSSTIDSSKTEKAEGTQRIANCG